MFEKNNAAIAATEPATTSVNGFVFIDETKVFKDSDEIWDYIKVILDAQWDVLSFEEVPEGLKITTNVARINGWIVHPKKDGRFITCPDIREDVAEFICTSQDINPYPTRGRGGLDRAGGFGHISRGSRRCPEGYNYGYCY